MKLSVTQAILGVLIIFAAVYVTGWMIHEAPSQYTQTLVTDDGKTTYIDVVPDNEGLFSVSRYGSYALPVFGVLVLIIGMLQSVKASARNRSLITVSIIAGALTAVLAYIITMWGYPTTFRFTPPEGINMLGIILTNPGRAFVGLQLASGLMVMLGLAMFGVGIAQLVKSRKTPSV